MIDKGVQVSGKEDAGKCSAEEAQIMTVTPTWIVAYTSIFFLLVIREIYFTVFLQCDKITPSLVLCCTFVRKKLPPVYCF